MQIDIHLWVVAGVEASTEARESLRSKGIATHFLENGVLMEELPDGTVRRFEDRHTSSTTP